MISLHFMMDESSMALHAHNWCCSFCIKESFALWHCVQGEAQIYEC